MTEGMEFERLPEGTEEARDFRDTYAKCPISGVQRALRIWTVTHQYPQGSQAKVLAAMTNIVSEHIEELHDLRSRVKALEASLQFCTLKSAELASRAGSADAAAAKILADVGAIATGDITIPEREYAMHILAEYGTSAEVQQPKGRD